ncbi:MAG: PorP/SprF family type IX secretion system membrane protein [Bacteroidales bacterium]|nr:PorP/SprF family type IX secretion system membrane protein [Bacteroidales bacterium]
MYRYLILIFILFSVKAYSQSAGYSQSVLNQIYTNSAFSGSKDCPRVYLSFRSKYVSCNRLYENIYVSYDQHLRFLKSDISFYYQSDLQGTVFHNQDLGLNIAKGFKLTRKSILKLAAGIQYLNFSLNTDNISTPDMIDSYYGFVNKSLQHFPNVNQHNISASASVLFYTKTFFGGIHIKNIIEPKVETDNTAILRYRNYLIQSGYTIALNATNDLDGLFYLQPNIFTEFNAVSGVMQYGIYFNKKLVLGGLWLKQNFSGEFESFVILVGFFQKKFKFAYSCDVSIANLSGKRFDIHEISLSYQLNCKERKKRYEAIKAPGF